MPADPRDDHAPRDAPAPCDVPAPHDHHAHPPGDFGYGFHTAPRRDRARRRLVFAIGINVVMMVAEVIGGVWTGSLALLSDAGHMFTHVFALVVSLVAVMLTERQHDHEMTWGYQRAEPIAAMVNGVTVFAIVVAIAFEAVQKLVHPSTVRLREMFVVAVAGLVVNLIDAMILRESARDDINIRGAFLHLLADLFSSVAIVVGGLVMMHTGWMWVDPVLGLFIGVVVAVWAVRLLRDSWGVLMEAAPSHVDVRAIRRRLCELDGVRAVHDVHVWQVGMGQLALTCHVMTDDGPLSEAERVMDAVNRVLHEEFGIGHTTLQLESWNPSPHGAG